MFRGEDIVSREDSTYVIVGLDDGKGREIPEDLIAKIV